MVTATSLSECLGCVDYVFATTGLMPLSSILLSSGFWRAGRMLYLSFSLWHCSTLPDKSLEWPVVNIYLIA